MKKHEVLYFMLLAVLASCSTSVKVEVADYEGNALIFTSLHSDNYQIDDTSCFFESQRCIVYLFPDIDSVQFGELDVFDKTISNRASFQLYLSPLVIGELLTDENRKVYWGSDLCGIVDDSMFYSKAYINYKNHYPALITEEGLDYSVNEGILVDLFDKECVSYMLLCNKKEDCSVGVKIW